MESVGGGKGGQTSRSPGCQQWHLEWSSFRSDGPLDFILFSRTIENQDDYIEPILGIAFEATSLMVFYLDLPFRVPYMVPLQGVNSP